MAVELANAYVTLSVETSNISKQVGRMFTGVESQAGKAGRGMGRSMADSFDAAKPNVEKLSEDVKRAQDRVVAHKDSGTRKMEAANRRVEIAQAKVNEVTAKYGEDSSQALRAQDQLITAQQKAEAETLKYNSSIESLESQLKDAKTALDDATAGAEKSSGVWDRVSDKLAQAGDKMRGIGDRFQAAGQQIGDVGSELTKKITLPIGGAITAAAGLAAALGFKRLVGIDTAQAQIRGLGYDVEKVMADVDKGVTDTALSMADGAAIARAALATGGVETGKELEEQIRRVANVSAAYGVESSHAGYLLNNVLTKGKVTYGDLSQMVRNQIPIISQLADHYGVTGEEIEKMAQEGKISIEDLNEVLDKEAGAAAEEYSKSWQGVTANIRSNLGKLGAEALVGVFETLKTEAGGFLEVLRSDQAKEIAKTIGEKLGDAFKRVAEFVRTAVEWFTNLDPVWQKTILGAVGLAVALGPILIVVGKIATGIGAVISVGGALVGVIGKIIPAFKALNAVMKANLVGIIITAITALVGAFIYLWKTNEGFRNFFINLWQNIAGFFVGIWENYIKPVFDVIAGAWGELTAAFQGGDDGYGFLAQIFGEGIAEKIVNAFGFIGDAIANVKGAFGELFAAFRGEDDGYGFLQEILGTEIATALIDMWARLGTAFRAVKDAIATGWKWLVNTLKATWENVLKPVFHGIGTVVSWLWKNIVKPNFNFVMGLFLSLGEVFHWVWNNVLSPVFGWIGTAVTWLWQNIIKPYIGFVGSFWAAVFTGMAWAWNNVLAPVIDFIGIAITWLWENVAEPVFGFIGAYWGLVFAGMKLVWQNILWPVFQAIGAVAVWLWQNVLEPTFSWIGEHWSTVMDIMKWAWDYILKPVWDAIVVAATWLWETILEPIFSWIGDHWDAILLGMQIAWNHILKPAWNKLVEIAQWLWNDILEPIFRWIGDKWSEMSDRISNIYNDHIKPIFDGFNTTVDALKTAFEVAVDVIKDQWNKLKAILAAPIKFVIEKVYNDGIVELFNGMVDTFGLNKEWELDPYKPAWLSEYATGGYTGDGHWLEPKGIVHGGEYVLNKVATNRLRDTIGMSGLDHMNKTGQIPGYYSGGLVRPVRGGRVTSGFGASRGRYPHAGIDFAVPIGTPVYAAMDGTALGHQPTGRTGRYVFLSHGQGRYTYYGHLSQPLVRAGQAVSKGQQIALSGNTGNSTGPHVHYETWVNGKPVNPAAYLTGAMLPVGSGGPGDVPMGDPTSMINDFIAGIIGKVTGRFDGTWAESAGTIMTKVSTAGVDAASDAALDVASAMAGSGGSFGGFLGNLIGGHIGREAGKNKNRDGVREVANRYGWDSGTEWDALDKLIQKESGWNLNAANPNSSARGLFQKMTSLHGPVGSTAQQQAEWGLNYIWGRYGSPSKALAHHNRVGHYATGGLVRDSGGVVPPGSSVIHNWTRDPEWMYTNKQQDTVQAALDVLKDGAGTSVNFYGPTYMRDEDQFAEHYEERARRQRKVSLV